MTTLKMCAYEIKLKLDTDCKLATSSPSPDTSIKMKLFIPKFVYQNKSVACGHALKNVELMKETTTTGV